MGGTSKNIKIIRATQEQVYNAFTDKKALEFWLAPNNMTGRIHNFELAVGSGYEMSLFYLDPEESGKTAGNEDRFSVKFLVLKPFEEIVQAVNFRSDKKEFSGEMIMEVFLDAVENNSTRVTVVFKNIPVGINPKDNEVGTDQSLEKLAHYVDANRKNK